MVVSEITKVDIGLTDFNEQVIKDEKDSHIESEEGPDGGFGWIVVAACFIIQMLALGLTYSFGIFLEHYVETWADRADIKSLSFIGTLSASLISLAAGAGGFFAERVGYPIATGVGGVLFSLGLLLASFSTKIWQLYFTQGIMVGLGGATMYITTASAPSQWFTKKRGLATGICLTGAGIGGLTISPILRFFIDKVGTEWTLRIFSGVSLILTVIAAPFVRTRIPFKPGNRGINLAIFRNPKFFGLFIEVFVGCIGYLVPLFLMNSYAISCGLPEVQATWLVGIMNGGSALGSITLGYLADFLGPLNILTLSMFIRGLMCSCFWPFATAFGPLVIFSIIYGATTGAFLSIMPVAIGHLFGLEEMASISGLIYLGSGIPELIGTPLGTYILQVTSSPGHSNYLPVILYSGSTALLASIVMLYVKLLVNNRVLSVV